jgi:hypothetical protein
MRVPIPHIVTIFRKILILFLFIDNGLYAQNGGTDKNIELRSDTQSPITQEDIANATKELSTPKFTYKDFYIGPEVGASILMDVSVNLNTPSASGEGTVEANTGVRLDVPMGYVVSDFFAFEFSPGIIYNGLSTVESGGYSVGLDGYILQVPLLVNMIWSLEETLNSLRYLALFKIVSQNLFKGSTVLFSHMVKLDQAKRTLCLEMGSMFSRCDIFKN